MAISLDQVSKKSKAPQKSKAIANAKPNKLKTKGSERKKPKVTKKASPRTAQAPEKKSKTHVSARAAASTTSTASPPGERSSSGARQQTRSNSHPSSRPQVRPQVRPWSQKGLAKEGRSPKDRVGSSHHMSEDLINGTPLFWMDPSDSRVAALQEKFLKIERKAASILRAPRELFARAKKGIRSLIG